MIISSTEKLLVCVSALQASVAHWRGGKITQLEQFAHDERGLADFRQFLTPHTNVPVFMMVDAVEEDYRFETREARVENAAEIDRIITEFTSKRDKYECMRVIGAAVPSGAVRDTLEILNDPNFEERAILQKIQHPAHPDFKMAGWPVRFNHQPPPVKPAPLLGQHSAEGLKDWLGMTDAQVAALRDDKII